MKRTFTFSNYVPGSNKYNYLIQQYATNVATPTSKQVAKITTNDNSIATNCALYEGHSNGYGF